MSPRATRDAGQIPNSDGCGIIASVVVATHAGGERNDRSAAGVDTIVDDSLDRSCDLMIPHRLAGSELESPGE